MKNVLFLLIFSLTAFVGSAQQYQTAIGLKGGVAGNGALSIKHFMGGSSAFEFNLGGNAHSLWVQGLFEKNTALKEGFDWYWAIGPDFSSYSKNYGYGNKDNPYYNNRFFLGVSGLVGLEYTFEQIPINLAVDLGPRVNVLPGVFFGFGGGFAVRYAIK